MCVIFDKYLLCIFRVSTSINDLKLIGVKQGEKVPSLFNADKGQNPDKILFSVSYEKNPLDKLCGDRVIVKSTSVLIVYDAQTIIELIKMFKVQNPSTLNQWVQTLNFVLQYTCAFIPNVWFLFLERLQAAAQERLDSLKEVSALGLEYAIQKHAALDIQVDLNASQLIIPYGGLYNGNESLFVLNLGSLKMHTLEKPKGDDAQLSVKQLVSMGKTEEDILAHLRQYSYDKFVLEIVNFQVSVGF